jgi:CheY-like chemotaxis protein/glycine cleavage system H lipoate-binding protein
MSERKQILVVDDELSVCKSIASALADDAFDVSTVLSADEALQELAKRSFDVVISDLMMPGMSGMELLEKIHGTHPDTTVIMITGYPSVRSAVQAVKLGAFDYLPKPFTPNELRSLVSRALSAQEAKRRKDATEPHMKVPEGLYCIPENTWLHVEPDGQVRVGAHHLLLSAIERISSVELPGMNEMRYQGEACAVINDTDGHVIRLWTPVSGRIVSVNKDLQKDCSVLNADPYHDGWLFVMMPTHLEDELKNLVLLTEPA